MYKLHPLGGENLMKKWTISCLAILALVIFTFTANAEPVANPNMPYGTSEPLAGTTQGQTGAKGAAVDGNRAGTMAGNRTGTHGQTNRGNGAATTNQFGNAGNGMNYRANQTNAAPNNNWSWLGLLGLIGLAGLMGRNRNPESER